MAFNNIIIYLNVCSTFPLPPPLRQGYRYTAISPLPLLLCYWYCYPVRLSCFMYGRYLFSSFTLSLEIFSRSTLLLRVWYCSPFYSVPSTFLVFYSPAACLVLFSFYSVPSTFLVFYSPAACLVLFSFLTVPGTVLLFYSPAVCLVLFSFLLCAWYCSPFLLSCCVSGTVLLFYSVPSTFLLFYSLAACLVLFSFLLCA
jgi:hypothetical protein